MPAPPRKFPGSTKINIHIGDEVYTLWTSTPRSKDEEAELLTELREKRVALREKLERGRKRKRSVKKREELSESNESRSDLGRFIENTRFRNARFVLSPYPFYFVMGLVFGEER
jgi:hypothetical protein